MPIKSAVQSTEQGNINNMENYANTLTVKERNAMAISVLDNTKRLFSAVNVQTLNDAEILLKSWDKVDSFTKIGLATIVDKVHREKLFEADKFKSIDKWAKSRIGIAKTQTYNYINVAKLLEIDEDGNINCLVPYDTLKYSKGWDFSQLCEIYQKDENLMQLILDDCENDKINPSMQPKQIRKHINQYKNPTPEGEAPEAPEAPEKKVDKIRYEFTQDMLDEIHKILGGFKCYGQIAEIFNKAKV